MSGNKEFQIVCGKLSIEKQLEAFAVENSYSLTADSGLFLLTPSRRFSLYVNSFRPEIRLQLTQPSVLSATLSLPRCIKGMMLFLYAVLSVLLVLLLMEQSAVGFVVWYILFLCFSAFLCLGNFISFRLTKTRLLRLFESQ